MNKPVKTKLCWNCEGNVSRTAENCPYCAVYLSPEEEAPPPAPYTADKSKEIPKAPYAPSQEQEETSVRELPAKSSNLQAFFFPLIFLTTGLIFFFFALMLFLFSENGKLILQWDGDIWYIYGIISAPLLILGWYYLNQSSE